MLASTCEFGDQTESLIKDRIVLGIKEMSLQERLLREDNISLKKATDFRDFIRASENSQQQIKTIKK